MKDIILSRAAAAAEASDEELMELQPAAAAADKHDCATIVSTYSNLENHPHMLGDSFAAKKTRKIALSSKSGMPILREDAPKDEADPAPPSHHPIPCVNKIPLCVNVVRLRTCREPLQRKRGETAAEKHARKQLVKQQRQERRRAKKEKQLVFKEQVSHARAVATPGPKASVFSYNN